MQLFLTTLLYHVFFLTTAVNQAYGQTTPPGNAFVTTVYQFGSNMAAENLVMRPNGNILVTFTTVGEVWEVNPFNGTGQHLFTFPNTNSTSGIVEISTDVYAVAAGVFNVATLFGQYNTWAIWKIDYTGTAANITKLGDTPETMYINGIERLPNTSTILMSFSTIYPGDAVWSFNTITGTHTPVITVLDTITGLSLPSFNGLKTRVINGQLYLYFSNLISFPLFGRVRINPQSGTPIGLVESIQPLPLYPNFGRPSFADDFAFDNQSRVYLTTQTQNQLLRFSSSQILGPIEVVAGGMFDPTIAGPAAARFGNLAQNQNLLYLALSGGNTNNLGPPVVPGRIVSLDTSQL